MLGLLVLCARLLFFAPPALQPGDLLLLEPESIARVEAAAKAGDVVAQSILGSTYLQGNEFVPRNVTQAEFWLRKVADQDRSRFNRIQQRMQFLMEKRQYEFDLRKRRAIDTEYLDLFAKELAYESAFLGLIEIHLGQHGAAHKDSELALRYMRSGAAYGFPSAQRMLGIVTALGLGGVPKNEIRGAILLLEAAGKGDPVAQRLLSDAGAYRERRLYGRQ